MYRLPHLTGATVAQVAAVYGDFNTGARIDGGSKQGADSIAGDKASETADKNSGAADKNSGAGGKQSETAGQGAEAAFQKPASAPDYGAAEDDPYRMILLLQKPAQGGGQG